MENEKKNKEKGQGDLRFGGHHKCKTLVWHTIWIIQIRIVVMFDIYKRKFVKNKVVFDGLLL